MTLCFVPKHEGGQRFPSAGPDNHQQRERTDYGEQEKLIKSQWDLTQAFFHFTGRKEALGQCSSMLHYCYVQLHSGSYYSITALLKVVSQDWTFFSHLAMFDLMACGVRICWSFWSKRIVQCRESSSGCLRKGDKAVLSEYSELSYSGHCDH